MLIQKVGLDPVAVTVTFLQPLPTSVIEKASGAVNVLLVPYLPVKLLKLFILKRLP